MPDDDDYAEALRWLYGRQKLGIKLGLDKVRRLLAAVDDPHQAFRSVHVAGTNGKGSVVWFVAEALRRSGHRTGMFTSPHLVRFTERIRVDGEPMPAAALAPLVARLRGPTADLDGAGQPPTFFELNTAIAFLHFRDAGVAWAVVETGMGGRLDATNVLSPQLTIITNVSDDHGAFLGDLDTIAREKAGIMKPGVPLVTAASGRALAIIKRCSHDDGVPMSILGEDYHVIPDLNGMRLVHPTGEAHYDVAAAGEHQLENAALAVAACDALRAGGTDVPLTAMQKALAETQVPGRLETLHVDGVEVLMDGAHNLAGAQALRWHLGRTDRAGFHLIVGFAEDKDWKQMLAQWSPLAAHVWAVPIRSPRALSAAEVGSEVPAMVAFDACRDFSDAWHRAKAAGAGQVLVAGSLFLVGEARAVLLGEGLEEVGGAQ